ncbi:hypothetical protein NW759_017695, partial [Fusarium solani]
SCGAGGTQSADATTKPRPRGNQARCYGLCHQGAKFHDLQRLQEAWAYLRCLLVTSSRAQETP